MQLKCTDMTLYWDRYGSNGDGSVSYINISEGTMGIKSTSPYVGSGSFYTSSMMTQELYWAVANLSCQEAQQNITTYACISANSTCLGVDSTDKDYGYLYIGYRCTCKHGFQGNPYIINGCQGSHKTYLHISILSMPVPRILVYFTNSIIL